MFIATPITNQFKLRRSEIKALNTLRSYGAMNGSGRVTINISSLRDLCVGENLLQKIKSLAFASWR